MMATSIKCEVCEGDMYIDDYVYRIDETILCSRSCCAEHVLSVGLGKGIVLSEGDIDRSVD